MNVTRSLRAAQALALGFLALCFSVTLVRAQAFNPVHSISQGKFSLPFEVQWVQAVLPAGEYSFSLESASLPALVIIRGKRKNFVIAAAGVAQRDSLGPSVLVVSSKGGKRTVRAMHLASLGLVVSYRSPKNQNKAKEELAQDPEVVEYVSILAGRQ